MKIDPHKLSSEGKKEQNMSMTAKLTGPSYVLRETALHQSSLGSPWSSLYILGAGQRDWQFPTDIAPRWLPDP